MKADLIMKKEKKSISLADSGAKVFHSRAHPSPERVRVLRNCLSCKRKFLAVPWQLDCDTCSPRACE